MATKDGIVSVSQLNNYIKGILDTESLLKNVSVVGEVSGFKISGEHAYFSIKDADAVLACRCFNCRRQEFLPKDGDSVRLTGSVSYHVKFGLSFGATKIVAYGKGAVKKSKKRAYCIDCSSAQGGLSGGNLRSGVAGRAMEASDHGASFCTMHRRARQYRLP